MEKNRVGRKIAKERTSEKKKRRTVWLMSEQMNRFYRGNMSPWEIIGKTANVIKANWCEKKDTRLRLVFLGSVIYCGEPRCKENYSARTPSIV